MLYDNPQAVVQMNEKCSRAFVIERSALSPHLYVLTLEPPLLHRHGIRGYIWPSMEFSLTGSVQAKISTYANDITVFHVQPTGHSGS